MTAKANWDRGTQNATVSKHTETENAGHILPLPSDSHCGKRVSFFVNRLRHSMCYSWGMFESRLFN